MTKEQEQAINNLQRLRKAYIDRHTSSKLKKKSVKDDITSYDIAIQAIRDLDTYREPYNKGYEDGVMATSKDAKIYVDDTLDEIRAEIEEQVLESLSDGGDDWFAAEKVNDCLEIVDKHRGSKWKYCEIQSGNKKP